MVAPTSTLAPDVRPPEELELPLAPLLLKALLESPFPESGPSDIQTAGALHMAALSPHRPPCSTPGLVPCNNHHLF